MICLTPLYLALASRMAGDVKLKWYGVALYPVPYTVLLYAVTHNYILCTIGYIWVFGWKLTGHADGFRNYVRDNTLSPVASFIAKKLGITRNGHTYDAIFWAIKGGVIASIPSIIIITITNDYKLASFIFCASFCGYPAAYWLGFNRLNGRLGIVNTAWGEALAGLFSGFGFLFLV